MSPELRRIKEKGVFSYLLQFLDRVETQDICGDCLKKEINGLEHKQGRGGCICNLEISVKLGRKLRAFLWIKISSVIIKLKKCQRKKWGGNPHIYLESCIWKLFSPLRKYLWLFVPVKEENVPVSFTQEKAYLCIHCTKRE